MYKSNKAKLLVFLLMSILIISGCGKLKLFQLPLDTKKVSEKVDSKVLEHYRELQTYKPTIGISKLGEERLVRRDLQDFIDDDWLKGWDYMQKLDLKTFAFDVNVEKRDGVRDGILFHEDKLEPFKTGVPIHSSKSSHTIEPGLKLSFVHLSDVQFHDERVYLFSKELTNFFDKFVSSFEHTPGMVLYDNSYYLTLIGTMKILCDKLLLEQRLKPSFMIHTGDAIDSGVVSELYQFIYITNKLHIPWYNVLGNHDYQVYGNLSSENVGVIRPDMEFQTINSRYNFINMHGGGFDVDRLVYFSPDNAPDDDTRLIGSLYNGFDVRGKLFAEEGTLKEREDKPCENCPGYYYFEALQPKDGEPGILCIALDTTTKDFKFAEGTVYRHNEVDAPPDEERRFEQINWLKGVLEDYSRNGNWMVLVFGHHTLDSFFDDSNKKLFELFYEPKYNIIAYFCGHTHEHQITYHKSPTNPETFGFWEIVADSIFEYPKMGSLVTFRYTEKENWEMVLQSFWPFFLENLDKDAPELLKKAKNCFDASKKDTNGKLLKRYKNLEVKHHDVILEFNYPKTK